MALNLNPELLTGICHGGINHDCPMVFHALLVEEFGFDLDGVRQLMLNGIDACWQPEDVKTLWRQNWAQEFDVLRSRLSQEPQPDAAQHISYRRHQTA